MDDSLQTNASKNVSKKAGHIHKVAKLIIVDANGHYLLLERDGHPRFGDDADLPGGTLEPGETILQTLIREVVEEIGFDASTLQLQHVYSGNDYSPVGSQYDLFVAHIVVRPKISLSWEHSEFKWVPRAAFLAAAKNATDDYMHMVYDAISAQ